MRFRSYMDGRERFLTPEGSMAVQAALRSDIALAFDECTPFHVDRDYTARSTERTHRWLARCLAWRAEHGPPGQLVYGIVQGGVYEDLRRASARRSPPAAATASRSAARWGRKGADVRGGRLRTRELGGAREALPRHLLGIGEVDDLIGGVELGIDTFDCAMPTRLGRHGTALVPDPANRWRLDLVKGRWRDVRGAPASRAAPAPPARAGLSRAYLSYLARAGELTAERLLTLHNLTFIARLMADLRGAILAGRLAEVAAALRAGRRRGRDGSLAKDRVSGSPAYLVFSLTSCCSAAEVCSTSE